MGESVGEIGLDLVVNKNDFDKQMSGVQNLAKKAGAALASAFAVKKVVDFGKKCLDLGSDLAEVQNVVEVTFPHMAAQVDEFAKSAINSFGLSETMEKQFIGTFGAMAKSFGFSEKAAYDMGSALTGLAGDVASFYNISQDEAYTKLKSVFTGETESLKDLGVVMTQTALDSYAMANGFGKTTQTMSEMEKVALRYQFVQDKLSAAQGDFARTSGSWANQMRILGLQTQSIMATIGQGLINLFTPIVRIINVVLGKIATLANAFKAFTELLTGQKSSGSGTVANPVADLGNAADSAAGGLEGAAGAADNLSDATNGVGAAAKKAAKEMRSLMGFDAINKLTEKSDSGSGSYGGGSEGTATGEGGSGLGSEVNFGNLAEGETILDEVDSKFSGLIKKAKELARLFKKGFRIGFGDSEKKIVSIQKHLTGIYKSLKDIFSDPAVEKAANHLFDSIALSAGKCAGAMGSVGLTIADNLIGGIDKYLNKSKKYISERLVSIFDIKAEMAEICGDCYAAFADVFSVFSGENAKRITASIIGIFSDGFLGAVELSGRFSKDIAKTITTPFIENKDAIKQAVDGTLAPIASVFETVWESVQDTAKKAEQVYDEHIQPLFEALKSGFSEIASALLEWYNTYITPVMDSWAQKFDTLWNEHIQPVFDQFLGMIGDVADMLKALWEGILQPFIQWVIENIFPVLAPILEDVGTAFATLFGVIADVCGGILESLRGVTQFFTGVFSGDWKKGCDGIDLAAQGLEKALCAVFDFLRDSILKPFSDFFTGVFEKDWTESFGELGIIANGFFDGIEKVWDDIKGIFNGIIKFINDIFQGNWESAWQACVDAFDKVFGGLVNIVKIPVNGVIALLNGLIGAVNSLLSAIESRLQFDFTIPNPFGGTIVDYHWRATLPRINYTIPALANGGYVKPNTPQLAMIGDNRHQGEVVAPEDKLRQMAMEAVKAAGAGGITKEELEQIINKAVMRIVAALSELGFYVDSERMATAMRMAAEQKEYLQNPVIFE